MRTFSRAEWQAAQQAWDAGGYGWRWQAIRRAAAERGFIYPPCGSAEDDRDAEKPSQRAILWRALEDNPVALVAMVGRSRSWSQVVDAVIGLEDRLRADAREADAIDLYERADDPTHKEATMTLGDILTRIDASR